MITLLPAWWFKFARMIFALSMAMLLLGTINLLLLSSVSRAAGAAVEAAPFAARDKSEIHGMQAITIVYSQPPSGTLFLQSSQHSRVPGDIAFTLLGPEIH